MKLEDRTQRLHIKMLHSRHLEKNKLGDPADRQMTIWLPPSYHKSKTQRYLVECCRIELESTVYGK